MRFDKNITEMGKPHVIGTATAMRSSEAKRGLEPHVDRYPNPMDATKVAGAGIQFGRAGHGPDAATGLDRGPFASRTKLTSNP